MTSRPYALGQPAILLSALTLIILFASLYPYQISHKPVSPSSATSRSALSFSPSFDEPVVMRIDYSSHYQYNTDEGAREFAKLLPSGGHLVHIADDNSHSSDPRTFTVTLFHQLKCLDVIRAAYASPSQPSNILTQHCMNYLRQSILCRPNLGLEPAKKPQGTAIRGYEAVCRDWTNVYAEAERNHAAYLEWRNVSQSNSSDVDV